MCFDRQQETLLQSQDGRWVSPGSRVRLNIPEPQMQGHPIPIGAREHFNELGAKKKRELELRWMTMLSIRPVVN